MLIDWFTVGAQMLNFLILVWLMKRFLYRPILHAIDAREKLIAKELADANGKKVQAQKDRDEFQHKNEEFEQQRAALLKTAKDEANAERQRLLEEARKSAEALNAKQMETLRTEASNLSQSISLRTEQEVFAIARKILIELATKSLEEQMTEVFTCRLREVGGKTKDELGKALTTATDPALVRSAFGLPPEQQATIQKALNETFSGVIRIRFEIAPDLISGIELSTNGQKIAWSVSDYLSSLELGVNELLSKKAESAPANETKAEPEPAKQRGGK
jgi:F-type H+-transporting ATPase subunit b